MTRTANLEKISRRRALVAAAGTLIAACRAEKTSTSIQKPSAPAPKRRPAVPWEDQLAPDGSIFDTSWPFAYYQLVRDSLLAAYEERECQMLALPSQEAEYAVFVACVKGARSIVVRGAPVYRIYDEALNGARALNVTPKLLSRVARFVHEYSVPVSSETFDALDRAWTSMLANMSPRGSHPVDPDGDDFRFAHRGQFGRSTWPLPGGVVEQFVATAYAMRQRALDAQNGNETRMITTVRQLLSRISVTSDDRTHELSCK